jgi:hypothetical protein
MRRTARENAPCALGALAGCTVLAWLGLRGFIWSDYESEAQPAIAALVHGHLAQFLRLAPAYGGSLVERAPFALVPRLWAGGELAVYRAVAVPCLLACAALGVWLVGRMRVLRRTRVARAVALTICVVNPLTLHALELGHPEELLGASLCVGAVLLAGGERPLWAGVALGLAIANKEWALLAVGPVLLALAPRNRLPCLASAIAVTAALLAPLMLVGSGGFAAATRTSAAPAAVIFHPWQIWWFLGHHDALGHGTLAPAQLGYRVGPAWTASVSHPSILALGLVVSVALWLRERRNGSIGTHGALLALALVMLLRCLFDTWDTSYYLLPFVFALLAWEVSGPLARPPLLAAASTVLASLTFVWLPSHASADLQAAIFLSWSAPLAAALAQRLFASPRNVRAAPAADGASGGFHEMTVSPLSRPLSTS